ncbi:Na+/H+ antiporter NhaA [Aminipila sp.]|uniref:Na+/H+ antiporter NhaA n=1 Tax=Aminipila sp. TaxID=2060095 RepID=UPI002898210E|nr:Na+/H+ antiporter NhaA [Aminipila sp.]
MKKRNNPQNFISIVGFFKSEATSGLLLIFCAIIALLIANSHFATTYNHILHTSVTIGYKQASLSMSVLHWVNDGLMTIFFFAVGMEIKRELVIGELKSLKQALLPISAAMGGMVVPAVIFTLFNYGEPTISGWGIPMATDIAFSLGILSLVGKRAPRGIVVFLTALAIADDLGAIIVIALFYTRNISLVSLTISALALIFLILANKLKITFIPIYLVGGVILWLSLLESGIHATIAGVLLGMVLPIGKNIDEFKKSVLFKLEHVITPVSTYVVMPIFALANSGVSINLKSLASDIFTPVSLGIIVGLIMGKQLGVFGVSYILIKCNFAKLPAGVTKKHLYGASVLAGIGFTMSLFISSLSFSEEFIIATAKTSIMVASVLSGILGVIVFKSIKEPLNEKCI